MNFELSTPYTIHVAYDLAFVLALLHIAPLDALPVDGWCRLKEFSEVLAF